MVNKAKKRRAYDRDRRRRKKYKSSGTLSLDTLVQVAVNNVDNEKGADNDNEPKRAEE